MDVVFQGELTKQGSGYKSWKRRLFKLRTDGQVSYANPTKPNVPLRAIGNMTRVLPGAEVKTKVAWPVRNLAQCFALETPSRTFFMASDSVENTNLWMLHLTNTMLRFGDAALQQALCEQLAGASLASAVADARVVQASGLPSTLAGLQHSSYSLLSASARRAATKLNLTVEAVTAAAAASAETAPTPDPAAADDDSAAADSQARDFPDRNASKRSSRVTPYEVVDLPPSPTKACPTPIAPAFADVSASAAAPAAAAPAGESTTAPAAAAAAAEPDTDTEDEAEADASASAAAPAVEVEMPTPAPTGHGAGGSVEVEDEDLASRLVEASWNVIAEQAALFAPRAAAVNKQRKAWVTVRVFVSSTFADMFSEREALVRQVFPRLRAWCDTQRIHIVECDLRWGVPKDSTTEDIIRTCLGELDRCIQENGNPFFINLLSERYGWMPGPDQVPPSVADEYRWVPNISITHMEILHGALRTANPNAAFFLRQPEFLSNLPDSFRSQFTDTSPLAIASLQALKKELGQRCPGRVFPYSCTFSKVDTSTGMAKAELAGLEPFADSVYEFLKAAIEAQYPLSSERLSEREELAQPHEHIVEQRMEDCVGFDAEVDFLMDRIKAVSVAASAKAKAVEGATTTSSTDDGDEAAAPAEEAAAAPAEEGEEAAPAVRLFPNTPLLYEKAVGSGKSTLMSALVTRARREGVRVFFHFFAADSAAESVDVVVNRILLELGGCTEPMAADKALVAGDAIRSTYHALNSAGEPVLLIFAGVAVFSHAAPQTLHEQLFPRAELYPFLQFVFTSDHRDPHLFNRYIRRPMPVLSREMRHEFVVNTLSKYNKRLDTTQMGLLLDNAGSEFPLWVALACEELRVFGVFETVTQRVRTLPPTLSGLLKEVLDRVRQEDTSGHLLTALALLYASASGISEREMLRLLGSVQKLRANDDAQAEVTRSGQACYKAKTALDDAVAAAVAAANAAAADAAGEPSAEAPAEAPAAADAASVPVDPALREAVDKANAVHAEAMARREAQLEVPFKEAPMAEWAPVLRRIRPFVTFKEGRMQLSNELVQTVVLARIEEIDDTLVKQAANCLANICKDFTVHRRVRDYFRALVLAGRKKDALTYLRSAEGVAIDFVVKTRFLRSIRCVTHLTDKNAPTLLMCTTCSMKSTVSPRAMNKMVCGLCGNYISSTTMSMAGKTTVTYRMNEVPAQLCPRHTNAMMKMAGPQKCYCCSIPFAKESLTPIILCMTCSNFKSCSHFDL